MITIIITIIIIINYIIIIIINYRNTLELVDKILKPLLILPCKGDSIEYRLGGEYYELLKSKYSTTETIAFEDENHGFWSRGGYCCIYVCIVVAAVIFLLMLLLLYEYLIQVIVVI